MVISVIIPNYNHGCFLKQRIDSVLNQTYRDFEIIILDDCSTDNSKEVIETYRENPKVSHIIYGEKNSGTFQQWNKGIRVAQGEWIWIAESDDWCEPTLLETLIVGATNKDCTLAFVQTLVVNNEGKIWGAGFKEYYERNVAGSKFIRSSMLKGNAIFNASMCIFKKRNFFNIDNKFTEYEFCGDWLFWIQIAVQGNVYISGKFLNYFRKHDKDISGSAFKSGLIYYEYIKLLKNLTSEEIIDLKTQKTLLVDRYIRFLRDKNIDNSFKRNIKKTFYANLGLTIFYHYFLVKLTAVFR